MGQIVRGEIKKIFGNKKMIGFTLVLLLLGWILFSFSTIKESGKSYSFHAYKKLVSEINKSDLEGEYDRLINASEDLLENTEYQVKYAGGIAAEYSLYRSVAEELEQVIAFEHDIKLIEKNTSKNTISLFSKDKYLVRNSNKTQADLTKLRNVDVSFTGTAGVNRATRMDLTDWCSIIIVVLCIVSLITVEHEEKTNLLLRSTPNGHKMLGFIKCLTGVLLVGTVVIIQYVFKLSVIKMTYGLGDSGSSIQSVFGYSTCPLLLSIKEYVLLYGIIKILVFIALYTILYFVAVVVRQAWKTYSMIVLVLGLSSIFTYQIGENDWLANLKWLNPISFLDIENIVTQYRNLNIVGYPVSYFLVVIVSSIFIIGSLGAGAVLYFDKVDCSSVESRSMVANYFHRRKNGGSSYILFGTELKKSWIHEKTMLFLILVIVVLGLSYHPLTERLYTLREIYYKQYVQEVEGPYTHSKWIYLNEELEKVQNAKEELSAGGITMSQSTIDWLNKIINREEGLIDAISYAKYIQNIDDGYFVYPKGYQVLLGFGPGGEELIKLNFYAILIMIGLVVPIWGIEEWTQMKLILRISMRGRNAVQLFKYINILLCGIITFAVVYLPWIYNVVSAYNIKEWKVSIVNIQEMAAYPNQLSMGQVVILFYLLHLLYLWIVGVGIKYINRVMKRFIWTAIVSAVVFLLPLLFYL